jgi:hypothetical protein
MEKQHLDSTQIELNCKLSRQIIGRFQFETILKNFDFTQQLFCKIACKIEAWMWDNIDLKEMILEVFDYSVMLAVDGGYL